MPSQGEIQDSVLQQAVAKHGAASVRDLIKTYLDDAPRRLAEFAKGIQDGDAAIVRRAAHNLKSSAAALGATAFSALCEQLETSARLGALAEVKKAKAELEQRLERVLSELKAALPPG